MEKNKLNAHYNFLVSFFEKMNILFRDKWCVLHSYESLPNYSSSDVDMALNSNEIDKLENLISEIAKKEGWEIYQKLWYDIDKCYYYVLYSRENNIFLAIDFLIDKKGIGKYGFNTEVLTEHCNTYKNLIPIPNNSVSFCYKFVKRIFKQISLEKDKNYLIEHFKLANLGQVEEILKKQFGNEVTKSLLHKFRNNDFDFTDNEIKELYTKKIKLDNKKNKIKKIISNIYRKFNRVIEPCGLIINIPLMDKKDLEAFKLRITEEVDLLFRYVIINKNNSFFLNFKSLSGSTLVISINNKNNKIKVFDHWLLPKVYTDELIKDFTNEEVISKSFQLILFALKHRNRIKG